MSGDNSQSPVSSAPDPHGMSDEQLVNARRGELKGGDEELMRRYEGPLQACCRRTFTPRPDCGVEDVAQKIWLGVFGAAARRPIQHFASYLRRAAAGTKARLGGRRHKRREVPLDDSAAHVGPEGVLDSLIFVEMEEEVLSMVSPDERTILDLLKRGHTQAEAAEVLNISPDRVYAFTHRLRQRLKERWSELAAAWGKEDDA